VLLQHPVGQQLGVGDVIALLVSLVQLRPSHHVSTGLIAVAGQLLQHSAGQGLSGDTLAQLLQVTVWQQDFGGFVLLCLQHPGAASMSADCACQLLELFAAHTGSVDAVSQLLLLPAVQQLSLAQLKPFLWQACRSVDQRICQALLSLPAVAAAQDDTEVQVIVTTGRRFAVQQGTSSNERHVEQGWCTCPGCTVAQ
jgi:hypothetical protein